MSNRAASLIRHGALLNIFFSGQFNSVDLPQNRGRKFGTREIGNTKIVGIICLSSFELIRSRDTDTLAPALYDRVKVWESIIDLVVTCVTVCIDEVHPFVIQDFLKVLKTAFLPKDIASRALQKGYAIRQGPAQSLAHEQGKWLDGTLRLAGRGDPGESHRTLRHPHIGNFGIALPQLEQFEEADINTANS
ncbi:hypothetical protein E4U61_000001 [Claviceps capensis]|nr:hypothetical protein E4U61_000001 [Claviceps capensis]